MLPVKKLWVQALSGIHIFFWFLVGNMWDWKRKEGRALLGQNLGNKKVKK